MKKAFLLLVIIFSINCVLAQTKNVIVRDTSENFNTYIPANKTIIYLVDSNSYYLITKAYAPTDNMHDVFNDNKYTLVAGEKSIEASELWIDQGTYLEPKDGEDVKLSDVGSIYFGDSYIAVAKNKTDSTLSNVKQVTNIQTYMTDDEPVSSSLTVVYCNTDGFNSGDTVILKKTDDSGWSYLLRIGSVSASNLSFPGVGLTNIYDTIYKYTGVYEARDTIYISSSINVMGDALYFNDDYVRVGYDSVLMLVNYSVSSWEPPMLGQSQFSVSSDPFSVGDTVYFDSDTDTGYEIDDISGGNYVVLSTDPHGSAMVGIMENAYVEQDYFESSKSIKLPSGSYFIFGEDTAGVSSGSSSEYNQFESNLITDTLIFDGNYYAEITMTDSILFEVDLTEENEPFNIQYIKINGNGIDGLVFGDEFLSARNDYDTRQYEYHAYFMFLPDSTVQYSIVKGERYVPPPQPVPMEYQILAKYSARSSYVLDEITDDILELDNQYTLDKSLSQDTDLDQPALDLTKMCIDFRHEDYFDALNFTYDDDAEWTITALVEIYPHNKDNDARFYDSPQYEIFSWKSNLDLYSINDQSKSYPGAYEAKDILPGVHMFTVKQNATHCALYLDGEPYDSVTTLLSDTLHLTEIFQDVDVQFGKLYDLMIYENCFDRSQMDSLVTYYQAEYYKANPLNKPTISNFSASGYTDGETLNPGDTINISYTFEGVLDKQESWLYVMFCTGGGTERGLTVSANTSLITLPSSGLVETSGYWMRLIVVDEYGVSSNALDYDTKTFTYDIP